MVGRERTSAFGNQVGVRQVIFVGRFHECIDAVVHIFLDGVVHGTLAVARTGAVVVHAQPAAAVHELHVVAHVVELDIELRGLPQGGLYAAYLGDLAADVEVDEFQAVFQSAGFELVEGFEQFAGRQSELAGVAPAFLPFAASRGSQFDAYADVGAHVQFLGHFVDDVQLVELFHNQKDAFTHLLCQQGQFDVVAVLVAVADDRRGGVRVDGNDGVQLGFRAGFQPEVELLAVADHFFHDGAYLVDLDGIDDEVFSFEAIFLGRFLEAVACLFDAVVQDVGEPHQHGSRHVAHGQFVHQFPQIDPYAVFPRADEHVSFFVDAEIIDSPSVDVIEFLGVFNAPFSHCVILDV